MATPSVSSIQATTNDDDLRIWAAVSMLVVAATAVLVSLVHVVDTDEGFVLLAGKMLARGSVLYRDFNFPYPPVSPYAYATWMRFFGSSWLSGRLLSALILVAIAWVLYVGVRRATNRRSLAIAAVLMYGFAAQTLIFFTGAKSHALTALLLLSAYVLIAHGRSSPAKRFGFGGILFALAVGTRWYVVAVAPLLLVEVYRSTSGQDRRRALGWFLAGGLAGAMVNLPFLIRSPSVFFFNIVGAHTHRNAGGVIGALAPKTRVLNELFSGTRHWDYPLGPPAAAQFWTLLLANAAYVYWCLRRHRRIAGAFWIAAAIGVVSILPNPPYSQYWSITIPFLVFGAALLFGHILDRAPDRGAGRRAFAAILLVAIAFIGFGQGDVKRYLGTDFPPAFDLSAVKAVSRVIDANTNPGDQVLSFWPGYLLETNAVPVPRVDNQTAWLPYTTASIPERDHERFRLASPEYIQSLIRDHNPRLIVVQHAFFWLYAPLGTAYFDATIEGAGYIPVAYVDDAVVYRCCRTHALNVSNT